MKAQYYTNLVEGGHTVQGDILLLIEESALSKVVRYSVLKSENIISTVQFMNNFR